MSYVSCHDDMCLVDRLRASIPGIGHDELLRLDLLAACASAHSVTEEEIKQIGELGDVNRLHLPKNS